MGLVGTEADTSFYYGNGTGRLNIRTFTDAEAAFRAGLDFIYREGRTS